MARAYQPRSRIRVPSRSLSLSFSLYLSRVLCIARHDGFLTPRMIKKVRISLHGKLPRERYTRSSSIGNGHARALPLFPSFARLSRIAEWIVIGYNRSRCRPPPPPPPLNMPRYSPVRYLSFLRCKAPSLAIAKPCLVQREHDGATVDD